MNELQFYTHICPGSGKYVKMVFSKNNWCNKIRKIKSINSRIIVILSLVILSRKHSQKDEDKLMWGLVYEWERLIYMLKDTLKHSISPPGLMKSWFF